MIPAPTRCCICRGHRQVGPLRDRIYMEPTSEANLDPAYTRGWMCEECATINWAWLAEEEKETR